MKNMKFETSNQFANYLLNAEINELYFMTVKSCYWDFVHFFKKPVFAMHGSGQLEFMEVWCTRYHEDQETSIYSPIGVGLAKDDPPWNTHISPGGIIQKDLYSDALSYGNSPHSWCLPRTYSLLHNFEVKIITYKYTASCKVRIFEDGFYRYSCAWELMNQGEDLLGEYFRAQRSINKT